MLLFSLDSESAFAGHLARLLGQPLSPVEDRRFEDGEGKLRPLVDPSGADVCVVQGLHGDGELSPHDRLHRLLNFVATLRDHGAARVTAVVPYLAYARKDRRTQPFDPLSLQVVARLFEAVGTDQVVVLEVHQLAAFQNAFRCRTVHVDAWPAFEAVIAELAGDRPVAVASPDPGGVKRAQLWRESLQARRAAPVGFAMVDKRRVGGRVSSAHLVAGDVAGMTVLLLDDLIASGRTMVDAARALRDAGAGRVIACAAHGLFTGQAAALLADEDAVARLIVTDSVPTFRLPADSALRARLTVVPAAPLVVAALSAQPAR